jgi:cell wall-associated NlpC family hydrolase
VIGHFRRFGLSLLATTIVLGVAASGLPSASADPISDKQVQAKAIQDQIDATNLKIGALGEQYNGALLKFQQAEQAAADAQARIAAAQAQLDQIRALIRQRGASIYRQAISGQSLAELDLTDAQQLLIHQKYAAAQANRDNSLVGRLNDAKQTLAKQKAAAEQARSDADAQQHQIQSTQQSLQALNAQQQAALNQVQGELVALVQQEQQRRLAAALAAAQSRFGGSGGNAGDFPNLPPPGPAAAQAIAYARAQLGKPYVYAAAGPDAFDCSGLVMAAYASAGISMPHYSGAQYASLPHVSMNAMLPGDLLYWGDGGSEHVAIYLGDARIIESGGTGNDVHIGPIWGQPSGAARPA